MPTLDTTSGGGNLQSVAYALRADPGGTGQGHNTNYVVEDVAHTLTARHDSSSQGTFGGTPLVPAVAPSKSNTMPEMVVRRLTPLETERLQGLPDGWTLFGPDAWPEFEQRAIALTAGDHPEFARLRSLWNEAPHSSMAQEELQRMTKWVSDSARYRLVGNAVATPVVHWIAQRLRTVMERR